MGWLVILLLALAIGVALWRFARFDRGALMFLASALLVAMAGYIWQGRPGLAGKPVPPPTQQILPDSAFARVREQMLGRFDRASQWLTIADAYHRSGDTRGAADIIGSGLRQNPSDSDLWVGLGNALVIHADGLMTPAAELAFRRADGLAPLYPGPRFFYGLALIQGGNLDAAAAVWRDLLASAPANAGWRPLIEERLALLDQARASRPGVQAGS